MNIYKLFASSGDYGNAEVKAKCIWAEKWEF